MALMTYEMAPVRADLPVLAVVGGAVVATGSTPFVVDQRLQIAVLTDFCNECGNCVTACPHGRPALRGQAAALPDRADFEAQASNAFMLLGSGVIKGRFDGTTHRSPRMDDSHTRRRASGRSSTATRSPWSRRRRPEPPKANPCRSSRPRS